MSDCKKKKTRRIHLLIYRWIDIQGHRGNITAWSITAPTHTNTHVCFGGICRNIYLLPPLPCVYTRAHTPHRYMHASDDPMHYSPATNSTNAMRGAITTITSSPRNTEIDGAPVRQKCWSEARAHRMKGPKFPVVVFVSIAMVRSPSRYCTVRS